MENKSLFIYKGEVEMDKKEKSISEELNDLKIGRASCRERVLSGG